MILEISQITINIVVTLWIVFGAIGLGLMYDTNKSIVRSNLLLFSIMAILEGPFAFVWGIILYIKFKNRCQ